MSNKRKKRTKRYSGEDAKQPAAASTSQPVVHRYEAVERNKLQEWWHTKKRVVKPVGLAGGGLLIAGWLIFELFQVLL